MTCRWDSDTGEYVTPEGDPCRRDEYGDPTKHCSARRTCSQHVGPHEQTCARCLARTRADITQIVQRAALMLPEAIHTGVDSEAANLAGPAADVEAWSWHKIAAKQGRIWHVSLDEEDDDWHAFTVLTRWAWMISNSYGSETPDVWTVSNAADYLTRVLHRVAQDDDQDFAQMARELRKCRARLESVLRDSLSPERGAPCPTCKDDGHVVRLNREYGHYCDSPTCDRINYTTDEADRWVCPRNPVHTWDVDAYERWITERQGA
jgi:hypothetical protein